MITPSDIMFRSNIAYVTDRRSGYSGCKELIQQLVSSEKFRPGMCILHDRREARGAPTKRDIQESLRVIQQHREQLEGCRWALVVGDPLEYGMGRMASAMADDSVVEMQVFYDWHEAHQWLLGVCPEPVV